MDIRSAIRSALRTSMGADISQPIIPSTINITSAQFTAGFTGSISTTKNAARIYGRGQRTLWCGVITGTGAVFTSFADFGGNDDSVEASIDGGAWFKPTRSGDQYTLFAGLLHQARFVQIRYGIEWSSANYILASGNVLAVTGQPPSMQTVSGWVQAGANSTFGFYNSATIDNTATYSPKLQAVKGTANGSNIGSIVIRGAFTEIVAMTTGNPRRVGVSKNGGPASFYTFADEAIPNVAAIRIPCSGDLATYNVWDSGTNRTSGGHFAVSGNAAYQELPAVKRMDQYGDSITYGSGPGASQADVELMRVAASLGFAGSTVGVSGHTIAQCKTLLDTVLPLKTVTSADVAILAIGRNNTSGGIDATEQADYDLCIDKLLVKGYGKILCRGILPAPNGSEPWTAQNAALQAVVTAKANPDVIWIPTSTWLGYGSQDGTHPTAAGYVALAGFAAPAYTTALGL
jgi:lysophospholipase L1-like esterase